MRTTTAPATAAMGAPQVLAMSLELGASEWKMAFSPGLGQPPRHRRVEAGDLEAVKKEIGAAKARFKLAEDVRVVSCYEAGRDGFWIHRALKQLGVENHVVDSAAIEVNRRARRAKTDRLDAAKLVNQLLRYVAGETHVWKVVRVPTEEEEDRRHLHRELKTVQQARTAVTNRIKGLLATVGVRLAEITELPRVLERLRQWNGEKLPKWLKARVERDWWEREQLEQRIAALETQRRALLRTATDAGSQCARQLYQLRGIGVNASWLYALEFFAWREFRNRRQVGGLSGLVPTPHQSGRDRREQGVCKAGNRWMRSLAIEIAWGWLRYQPQSELSRWYQARYGPGSTRLRKIGIVALARKLLIELWKYLQTGTPPAGAVLKKSAPAAS
ncbi:MAG TPA: IS110 family transposase [Longimicrobiaceae bacterium]|nr:IS110 family transposase [Longimicrobiaceae bacterium]